MEFEAVWKRIKETTGWSKFSDLAEYLDIKSQSVSGAKKRGGLPLEWVFKVAQGYQVSTDWLLTGEGPMHRGEKEDANKRVSEPDPLWGRTVREDHEGREYLVTTYEPDVKSPAPPRNELSPAHEPEERDVADQWGLKEEEILALFEEFWAGLPVDLKELVAEEVLENNDFFARWVKKRIRRRNKGATQSTAVNE